MRILAFDVSVSGCSVSFWDAETQFSCSKQVDTDRGQAEMLIPMIDEVMREAGCSLHEIDAIAVTRGPGSFTGVRIGLATARSLGLALDCPVIGLSTLDVIARAAGDEGRQTLFVIDTKRGDFYGQIGEGGDPSLWSEGAVAAYSGGVVRDARPDPVLMAQMVAQGPTGAGYQDSHSIEPLYLRGAEVSMPKREAPAVCFTDLE